MRFVKTEKGAECGSGGAVRDHAIEKWLADCLCTITRVRCWYRASTGMTLGETRSTLFVLTSFMLGNKSGHQSPILLAPVSFTSRYRRRVFQKKEKPTQIIKKRHKKSTFCCTFFQYFFLSIFCARVFFFFFWYKLNKNWTQIFVPKLASKYLAGGCY